MSAFTFEKGGVDVTDLVLTPSDFGDTANGLSFWYSDVKTVTNFTTITANIAFKELTPDGANTAVDYRLQCVLQGQEDNNEWTDLVSQGSSLFQTEQALNRRLIVTEGVSDFEPAQEFFQSDALGRPTLGVTHEQAPVPDDIRLCIVLGDTQTTPPNAALTSVKVSATGTLK